jgi:hypothetical protein
MTENTKEKMERERKMENIAMVSLAALIIIGMIFSFTFTGCAPNTENANAVDVVGINNGNTGPAANPSDGAGQERPEGNGNFTDGARPSGPSGQGNLTDEERQAMMEQRMNESISACKDMAEGDSCTISNTRGEMQGTCQTRDEALMCNAGFDGRQPPTGQPAQE